MDERILRQMKQQNDADNTQKLLRLADETLDAQQQAKLHALLRDRDALQSLMRSDKAQALLRRLQK